MKFIPTHIRDVFLLEPKVFSDDRGFFLETFRLSDFRERAIEFNFVQDNHSGSVQGTLRGMHYQIKQPQGKLVRAIVGEIFDVAVDLRRSSQTFGCWTGATLSSESKHQLWIPPGFAHGFYVLSEWAEIMYKSTDYYAPQHERVLLWNDPTIGIEWPLIGGQPPLLSKKDSQGVLMPDAELYE